MKPFIFQAFPIRGYGKLPCSRSAFCEERSAKPWLKAWTGNMSLPPNSLCILDTSFSWKFRYQERTHGGLQIEYGRPLLKPLARLNVNSGLRLSR